jgi:DNA polymerase-3 subunit chi
VEVEFHTGLAEPLDHAARLLRKALRAGGRVCVASPHWEALSRHLWVAEAREFTAHARPGVAAAVWRRSALWLLPAFDAGVDASLRPTVWINLGADPPARLDGCERLIELVGQAGDDAAAGRQRWRAYKALGLEPVLRYDRR